MKARCPSKMYYGNFILEGQDWTQCTHSKGHSGEHSGYVQPFGRVYWLHKTETVPSGYEPPKVKTVSRTKIYVAKAAAAFLFLIPGRIS